MAHAVWNAGSSRHSVPQAGGGANLITRDGAHARNANTPFSQVAGRGSAKPGLMTRLHANARARLRRRSRPAGAGFHPVRLVRVVCAAGVAAFEDRRRFRGPAAWPLGCVVLTQECPCRTCKTCLFLLSLLNGLQVPVVQICKGFGLK